MNIFKKKYYYRIETETLKKIDGIRDKDEVSYKPQAKLGRFGKWKGIYTSNNTMVDFSQCSTYKYLCLIDGGVLFPDISCAKVFIENFKLGLLRNKKKTSYIKYD